MAMTAPILSSSNTRKEHTMKQILAGLALCFAAATPALAACYGSDSFSTCTDNAGNTYNVQRYGNTTNVQGYGANGSTWNQTSNTIGNTTYHNGTAADGGNWNGTSTRIGGTTYNSGTDSDGNAYRSTCNQFGCY